MSYPEFSELAFDALRAPLQGVWDFRPTSFISSARRRMNFKNLI
jgi:hypothetical protein